jgi:hypothetical protein
LDMVELLVENYIQSKEFKVSLRGAD